MSDNSYFCGVDLTKNHFGLHVINQNGKFLLHKSVIRSKLLTTIAKQRPMRIEIEVCDGAQYLARVLNKLGLLALRRLRSP